MSLLRVIKPLIPQPMYGQRLLEPSRQSKQKDPVPCKQTCTFPVPGCSPAGYERVRNQESRDQIAAGSSSRDLRQGRRSREQEPAASGCTLPAGLGTTLGDRISSSRIPWDARGSRRLSPAPARHGEPQQQPEEESHGAALQGRGDDCWRAAEVGGDGALQAGAGLHPFSKRLKASSLSNLFPPSLVSPLLPSIR